jgi:hypothetical protein
LWCTYSVCDVPGSFEEVGGGLEVCFM